VAPPHSADGQGAKGCPPYSIPRRAGGARASGGAAVQRGGEPYRPAGSGARDGSSRRGERWGAVRRDVNGDPPRP